MDGERLGRVVRSLRIKRDWRQADVARRAGVSASTISRLERGGAGLLQLSVLRRIARILGARIDAIVRWDGGELDRLLSGRHSAMHEAMAQWFGSLAGWLLVPEASFSIYGERGVIDILAWHAASRSLIVIELKTEIVDVNDLVGRIDRKRRLARNIARDQGWDPLTISVWVVAAAGRTNARRIASHRTMLRNAFPDDGRTIAAWLRNPSGGVACLSFLPDRHPVTARSTARVVRRVRAPASRLVHAQTARVDADPAPG
jgi:transcriptional regulator with XRE-family HTH domain